MAGAGQLQPKRLDEGRLADAGNPGDADAMGITAMGQQLVEQRSGVDAVLGQDRLDKGDRPTDCGPVTGEYTGGEIGRHSATGIHGTTLPMMRPMIRHHVITTLNDDAKHMGPVIRDALLEWVAGVPECLSFEIGLDLELADNTGDIAIVAQFDSVEDYRVYATDERHLEIISTMIAPNATSIARSQIEL